MDMDVLLAGIFTTALVATISGSGLLAWRMWLRSKAERLRLGGGDEIEQLTEAMDTLHERMQLMQDEIGELHERVDFTERLLAKGDPGKPYKPDPMAAT
jgi:hypothetical protein